MIIRGVFSVAIVLASSASAFVLPRSHSNVVTSKRFSSSSDTADSTKLETDVKNLKRVLAREYATFFNPMETQYYAKDVSFTDPMTSLSPWSRLSFRIMPIMNMLSIMML